MSTFGYLQSSAKERGELPAKHAKDARIPAECFDVEINVYTCFLAKELRELAQAYIVRCTAPASSAMRVARISLGCGGSGSKMFLASWLLNATCCIPCPPSAGRRFLRAKQYEKSVFVQEKRFFSLRTSISNVSSAPSEPVDIPGARSVREDSGTRNPTGVPSANSLQEVCMYSTLWRSTTCSVPGSRIILSNNTHTSGPARSSALSRITQQLNISDFNSVSCVGYPPRTRKVHKDIDITWVWTGERNNRPGLTTVSLLAAVSTRETFRSASAYWEDQYERALLSCQREIAVSGSFVKTDSRAFLFSVFSPHRKIVGKIEPDFMSCPRYMALLRVERAQRGRLYMQYIRMCIVVS